MDISVTEKSEDYNYRQTDHTPSFHLTLSLSSQKRSFLLDSKKTHGAAISKISVPIIQGRGATKLYYMKSNYFMGFQSPHSRLTFYYPLQMKVCLQNCLKPSNQCFHLSRGFYSHTGCRNAIQMAQDSHIDSHIKSFGIIICQLKKISRL